MKLKLVQGINPGNKYGRINVKAVRENLIAYSMITPALFFFTLFLVIPLFLAVYISFYKYSGIGKIVDFIGWDNFIKSISDKVLYSSILTTLKLVFTNVFISITIGFLLAYFLSRKIIGHKFFSVALYMPALVTEVVSALIWKQLLEPNFGLINTILRGIGLDILAKPWLNDTHWALIAGILATSWKDIPFIMLVLYASILRVPQDMIEASIIDGANEKDRILKIILPYVKPVIGLLATLTVASGFRGFGMIYVLTQGGPANATQIATIYVFKQAALWGNYGYANAIAFEIAIILGIGLGLVNISAKKMGLLE